MATEAAHVDFTEAAAPATPGTGIVRIYAKTDGAIYQKDDAGVESALGGAGVADILDLPTAETDDTLVLAPDGAGGVEFRAEAGGTTFPRALSRLTSGDVTISATTNVYASNVTGVSDLVLACVTGDYIEVGVSARAGNTTAQSMKFDVCSVVGGAAVNFLSNGTGTGSTNGVPAWYINSGVIAKAGGSILYVAQSGDLSGGNITLRLTCFVSASTRVVDADANDPLEFWAINHRQ